jgi:hypothetical protein
MALSASVLSAAMRSALLANPDTQALPNDALTAVCDAIAQAVVSHITASAIVLPLLMVAPPGGGPVTGTGVVT